MSNREVDEGLEGDGEPTREQPSILGRLRSGAERILSPREGLRAEQDEPIDREEQDESTSCTQISMKRHII